MDKIKINISNSLHALLAKDMKLMGFVKKDGSLNTNLFLTTLINNYHREYEDTIDKMTKTVSRCISDANVFVNKDDERFLVSHITNELNTLVMADEGTKSEKSLAIRPTQKTYTSFNFIENYLLKGTTISAFYRNLFLSYTAKPLNKREQIIFKESFDKITSAIKSKKKIHFTLKKENIISPFTLASSKEDLFNYVVGVINKDTVRSYRLSKMKNISIINEPATFSGDEIKIINQMLEYGPQFYIKKNEQLDIVVKLNQSGKDMYEAMYLYRPELRLVDGDIYHFVCSQSQAHQYFSRFGQNALIIEPEALRKNLARYYKSASFAYRDLEAKIGETKVPDTKV